MRSASCPPLTRRKSAKAGALAQADETTYLNWFGETVSNAFLRIVEVQWLVDDHICDGMEVASWMFKAGECLELSEEGIAVKPARDGASSSALSERLLRIETVEMGLSGDRERALRVAEKLRALLA